jgi:hypothetical protein
MLLPPTILHALDLALQLVGLAIHLALQLVLVTLRAVLVGLIFALPLVPVYLTLIGVGCEVSRLRQVPHLRGCRAREREKRAGE